MFLKPRLSASYKLKLCICTAAVIGFTSLSAQAQDELDLDFSDSGEIQQLLPEEESNTDLMDSSMDDPMAVEAEMDAPAVEEDGLPEGITVVDEAEQADVAVPPVEPLAAPQDPNLVDVTTPQIPSAAPVAEDVEEDLFFDAEQMIPQSELSRKGAPSKVDPMLNPGSRLVVTRTTANPGSREAQLVAAERATKLGRLTSALQIYDGLYARNKRDPNILLGRAVTLQRLDRIDEAINAYEELLDIRPNNLEAQINLHGLMGQRYPAVARRNLVELFDENPGSVAVIAQLAMVEAKLGNFSDAIKYLGIAASLQPENANHIFNMAIIADRAGDKKKAIEFYEQALEIDTLYGAGVSIPRDSVFQRLAELR
jgi:tetratricopeptide (TPR) repeat protein